MLKVRILLCGVILTGALHLAGCSPASLAFLVMPFADDKVPARRVIANKEKEVTVAVLCSFENFETRPEIMALDHDLSERLTQEMRKAYEQNKDRVNMVAPVKVNSVLTKIGKGGLPSLEAVGRQLNADYVINLEIVSLSIYEQKSINTLMRGNAEINVTAFKVHAPAGESLVFKEIYACTYPTSGPRDASAGSPAQFRAAFVGHMARDLTRYFVAHANESRFDLE